MADNTADWNDPTSSGGVDTFDGVVKDARFDFIPAYNDGNMLCLILDVKSEDQEVGFEGTGEIEISFPCGKDWDKVDKNGTAANHPGDTADRLKKPNNNSGMGMLLESVKEIPELVKVVAAKGGTREAKVWKGLDVEWHRREVTFAGMTDETTGEPVKARRWVVTGFNGAGGKAEKGSAPAAATSNGAGDLTAVQKVGLKKLAAEASDLSNFQELVLTNMPEFAEGELTNWVLDAGCWDTAKAF